LEESSVEAETFKRSKLLTLISLLLGLTCIASIFISVSDNAVKLGILYQVQIVISTFIIGVAAAGIWLNLKWGAYTYIIYSLISPPLLFVFGWWRPDMGGIIIPAIIVFLLLIKIKTMK